MPSLFTPLLEFLFPPRCLVCSKSGVWLHGECRLKMPAIPEPRCPVCGQTLNRTRCNSAVCQMPERALARVASAYLHTGAAREAVLKLKYQGVSALAATLAQEMAYIYDNSNLSQVDIIVAVSLHHSHLKERGYNQAGLLAHELSRLRRLPDLSKNLARLRQTRSQVGLGLKERAENVKDAFVWKGERLDGKRVLLVDDVCTTGATLNACAGVLVAAGASIVEALTFTREDHRH
jgi:ComF family protein